MVGNCRLTCCYRAYSLLAGKRGKARGKGQGRDRVFRTGKSLLVGRVNVMSCVLRCSRVFWLIRRRVSCRASHVGPRLVASRVEEVVSTPPCPLPRPRPHSYPLRPPPYPIPRPLPLPPPPLFSCSCFLGASPPVQVVKATLAKKELQETFLEFDLLGVVKRWLQVGFLFLRHSFSSRCYIFHSFVFGAHVVFLF